MKRSKVIIVGVLVLALMFVFAACGGSGSAGTTAGSSASSSASDDALKGKWTGTDDSDLAVTWNFDGKGKCTLSNEAMGDMNGTYTISGSNVTIKLDTWDAEKVYAFVVDGNSLKLTGGAADPNYELTK